MKLTTILFTFSLLFLSNIVNAENNKMQTTIIQQLEHFQLQDHFLPDNFLYTGVHDSELKKQLNQNISDTSRTFIKLYQGITPPTKQQLLQTLSNGINQINSNQLDTEDREQVAANYEKFLDIIGLESSEGILNSWLYNQEISDMIEQGKSKPH